ncbi:hypothetical protein AC231_05920 [Clostridium pasteurianum]|uniref:hypothetical protein n=1 Tax=Clostridium pasteurianum TaxID=1501 RepID=UPI0009780A33|nr:hypothetical protein [Clostridium pasteurianum]OMH20290.1 hypothetical protein AC231_05920 [Clostridium pasteurianum]
MDNRCNKDGDITETKWTLNFKAISNNDKSVLFTHYTLDLFLDSAIAETLADKNSFNILILLANCCL